MGPRLHLIWLDPVYTDLMPRCPILAYSSHHFLRQYEVGHVQEYPLDSQPLHCCCGFSRIASLTGDSCCPKKYCKFRLSWACHFSIGLSSGGTKRHNRWGAAVDLYQSMSLLLHDDVQPDSNPAPPLSLSATPFCGKGDALHAIGTFATRICSDCRPAG